MGLFDIFRKKDSVGTPPSDADADADAIIEAIKEEIRTKEAETAQVMASEDLTPEKFDNKRRRYHYKNVEIWISWQYGGQYEHSCESIGMKRGDTVKLVPPKTPTEDPYEIAVRWNGIDIGVMKANRLREMVHKWKLAEMPVLAYVSHVGGVHRLLLELAFYGYPHK